jgi:UDP-2,3-diacylglucosamine hydrolase
VTGEAAPRPSGAARPRAAAASGREGSRWSAAFAADLHLAPADAGGIERAVRLVGLCAARSERLFLLGDVFDLWTSGAELELAELAPFFSALRAAGRGGLAIDFLAGNRDFNFTASDGARVGVTAHAEEELEVELDGRRLLLLHGDQLLSDDRAYQRMKKVIRAAPARFLARHLPARVSLALGRRLRSYSDRVVPAKRSEKLRIVPDAVRERLRERFDLLLCGHVHRLERLDFGGGRELVVLPPFFEEGRFAALERGRLAIAALDGELRDLPAARAPES